MYIRATIWSLSLKDLALSKKEKGGLGKTFCSYLDEFIKIYIFMLLLAKIFFRHQAYILERGFYLSLKFPFLLNNDIY